MADRKAELERKKERLRQIREDKERRRREREQADAEASLQNMGSGRAASAKAHDDINKQLENLGLAPVDKRELMRQRVSLQPLLHPIAIARPASEKSIEETGLDVIRSLPSGGPSSLSSSDHASSAGGLAPSSLGSGSSAHPDLEGTAGDLRRAARSKPISLGITPVHQTSIPPKQSETYAKQTQTIESGTDHIQPRRGPGRDYYTFAFDDPEEFFEEDSLPGLGSGSPSSGSPSGYLAKLPPGILPPGMPEVKDVKPTITKEEEERKKAEEERKRRKELSEEEKQIIMLSEDFHKFFDRSARIVERALYEDINVFVDYTGAHEDGDGWEEKAGINVTLNRYFFDERWTKNRVVTSMDWSSVFPELMVASYDKNAENAADPDGVCLVWNTRFKKTTPEHVFHCQSQVMSATFARFHPNLILGGTYSGQIVLWDNRVQKRTPVQRSPLSASAHTHPVYCMRVVGTQNAHNLISISTDGKLCSWSLDMLSAPQEHLELQQRQSKAVAVTCLDFPAGDVNNFVVGSEEGAVYTACRHGSRAGVLDVFDGHQAPVTGLHTHPSTGNIDFSHLFLTCSMDWTIKLWSLKENRPLYSFEDNGDYVYDVSCLGFSHWTHVIGKILLNFRMCLPDPASTVSRIHYCLLMSPNR